jgi:medium-chain acyl-[acyl-carrier-protein] hydrolase
MTTTSASRPSVIFSKANPQASLRLFCFPYAGGSTTSFRNWQKQLPTTVEVCPIELPGRGTKLMETPFTELSLLVPAIVQAIFPYLDKPFAFFGHSMGAILSFEVARQLRKKCHISPAHLFVSGRGAPHVPFEFKSLHSLPKAEFIEQLRKLNGTPDEVLDNAELMEMLIPMLRADFKLIETYAYTPGLTLGCPITAFGGLQDGKVSLARLEAWQEQTNADFSVQMFSGDHFFLHSAEKALIKSVSQKLHHLTNKANAWQSVYSH